MSDNEMDNKKHSNLKKIFKYFELSLNDKLSVFYCKVSSI